MKSRHWKSFTIAALAALNAGLFISLQNKQEDLQELQTELMQSPVLSYIENNYWEVGLKYLLYGGEPSAQSLALSDASAALTKAIKVICDQYIHDGINARKISPQDYFSKKIAVDSAMQSGLWKAFGKYNEGVLRVLEVDISRKIKFRDSLGNVMQAALNRVETNFKASPPGSKLRTTLLVHLRGVRYDPHGFDLVAVRVGDSIQWEDDKYSLDYDDYCNVMAIMKQTSHSSKVLQLRQALSKMNLLFTSQGKLDVYQKVYTLSSITMGELESVCKQMLQLQWKTNKELVAAYNELSHY